MSPRFLRQDPSARRRAFTMVEVLVSMVLMAVILPVAMQGISLALRGASLARQKSVAASLAQTQMADLIAAGDWSQANMQGAFPDDPDYTWTAELTEWSGTTVEQLEVDVLWTARGQQRSVSLDTLIYTGSGAAAGISGTSASTSGGSQGGNRMGSGSTIGGGRGR
jgi:prepilin-type N-terminal cleavage/methylation domain-containing protein